MLADFKSRLNDCALVHLCTVVTCFVFVLFMFGFLVTVLYQEIIRCLIKIALN